MNQGRNLYLKLYTEKPVLILGPFSSRYGRFCLKLIDYTTEKRKGPRIGFRGLKSSFSFLQNSATELSTDGLTV